MANEREVNDEKSWSASLRPSHLLRHNREELFYIAAEPLRAPALAARRAVFRIRSEKPLGYIGWIGHRNLGDEVMFKVICRALAPFSTTPFVPPVAEAAFARVGLGGPDFFRAVLLGGGTLINPLFLRAAKLARTFQAPLHTVGTGVGSPGFGMPTQVSLKGWCDVLSDSLVSVRGPLSLQLLQDAGLKQTVAIGDPALGLTPEAPPAFRTRNRLVVNLALEPGTKPSAAESKAFRCIGVIAKQFLDDGGEVTGVALGNGDRSALTSFRTEFDIPRMTIEDHRTSAESLLRSLVGSVGLIGVRLHSAVLASCVGVPSILIAYRAKCQDFMASMNLTAFAISLSPDAPADLIVRQWNQIVSQPQLGNEIHQRALYWKKTQGVYYRELAKRILAQTQG